MWQGYSTVCCLANGTMDFLQDGSACRRGCEFWAAFTPLGVDAGSMFERGDGMQPVKIRFPRVEHPLLNVGGAT